MEISVILLGRLNPSCARALEEATSLCSYHRYAEIMPEHWLFMLFGSGEEKITEIAHQYNRDLDSIRQDLLTFIEQQPQVLHNHPRISAGIENLMKQAWLYTATEEPPQISESHLLMAVAEKNTLMTCHSDELHSLACLHSSLHGLLRSESSLRMDNIGPGTESGKVTFIGRAIEPKGEEEVQESPNVLLNRLTRDVTACAREGKIAPVLGRDNEIRQILDILLCPRKNNPVLVGDPGVGKTTLVEGLALQIVEGNVPDCLKLTCVRTLDSGLLLKGGLRESEQRLKNIIHAIQQAEHPVLLFIDDVHTLCGTGNQTTSADVSGLLKSALSDNELRIIAATTWTEYSQFFGRDVTLQRQFRAVQVDEPDDDTACLMLRGYRLRYSEHYRVHITDDALRAAVTMSRRYLAGRQLPDKGIDLLDAAIARVRINQEGFPEELIRIKTDLLSLELEEQALQEDEDAGYPCSAERRARIIHEHDVLSEQYHERKKFPEEEKQHATGMMACRDTPPGTSEIRGGQPLSRPAQQHGARLSPCVDVIIVAQVVADRTGIPLSLLMMNEQTELLHLEQNLSARVTGQESALSAIARHLRASRTSLTPENCPRGAFLLAGPCGTGKTETALALAEVLSGGDNLLITINLSDYQEPHTVSRLKGMSAGYPDCIQEGILTEAVRKRPYSVILLNEVEKAHAEVADLLCQVFDSGFVYDGKGRKIDFRNTILLMTSRVGGDLLARQVQETPDVMESALQELLRPLLRKHIQPALLSRFRTVIYRPLSENALKAIACMKLEKLAQRLLRKYGMRTDIAENVFNTVAALSLLQGSGSCNIDSLLNEQLLPLISETLLQYLEKGITPHHLTLSWKENSNIELKFKTENNDRSELQGVIHI